MVAVAGGNAFEGKRKQMVAAKEKADQVSRVALFVRDCHVDGERLFVPHSSAGMEPFRMGHSDLAGWTCPPFAWGRLIRVNETGILWGNPNQRQSRKSTSFASVGLNYE